MDIMPLRINASFFLQERVQFRTGPHLLGQLSGHLLNWTVLGLLDCMVYVLGLVFTVDP